MGEKSGGVSSGRRWGERKKRTMRGGRGAAGCDRMASCGEAEELNGRLEGVAGRSAQCASVCAHPGTTGCRGRCCGRAHCVTGRLGGLRGRERVKPGVRAWQRVAEGANRAIGVPGGKKRTMRGGVCALGCDRMIRDVGRRGGEAANVVRHSDADLFLSVLCTCIVARCGSTKWSSTI